VADDRGTIRRGSECEAKRQTPESAAAPGRWIKFWVLLPLVLSYLVELIFTVFEFDREVKKPYFLFFDGIVYQDGSTWNGWVTDCNFVYGFMETAARGLIFLSAHWAVVYGVRLRIFSVCVLLEMADMLDYWLFYNAEWFNTGIEFNYIKIGVILFNVWREYNPQILK
jgi:hypothetical protein